MAPVAAHLQWPLRHLRTPPPSSPAPWHEWYVWHPNRCLDAQARSACFSPTGTRVSKPLRCPSTTILWPRKSALPLLT
ncbi:hypothetical protein BD626DRAFT_488049 [Schizophyllum amplum]|uniref:Uncharacterized protein n=1 Tax=Schizophyllum amplum TaxID=97359 RepID=A0A550CK69_9AGAR|nr:hypothetical protein BD626DRAFT_488049 [Auriculariopsis ampla]